jgi:hypothetical protein
VAGPRSREDTNKVWLDHGIDMRTTHGSKSKKRAVTQTLKLELELHEATQIVRALGQLEGLPVVLSARRVVG